MDVKTIHLNNVLIEINERPLFRPIDIDISSGQALIIKGSNGVGKSTLLRAIIGLRRVNSGVISYDGNNIFDAISDYHTKLSYIGHKAGIPRSLTANEYLTSLSGNQDNREVLSRFGLIKADNLKVEDFSEGMIRRLALARLLVENRPIWVLDEPATALDADGVECLESIMVEHCEKGKIAIVATHQNLSFKSRLITNLELKAFEI